MAKESIFSQIFDYEKWLKILIWNKGKEEIIINQKFLLQEIVTLKMGHIIS
ncbi:hypothetical protein HMPREF0322_00660 [Desulfitobacterium hafniense DP7]|uniref:Uncharacterized protein n=1 Tax=Desulfitobacterium hafniense DP7 TaxID=537010 RepID=G9XI84_DESHA|nr:hypothetical protein HMPREF0322_00660 [Desulfitobacterium hafniense DP7]